MSAQSGVVYLVGAGPGDPRLITVQGLSLLRRADVVLHDRLVSTDLLAEAPPGAEIINVGKAPRTHRVPQDQTNHLLIEYARQGKTVVRLKGGDPFVFGRGYEELQACRDAGIPCVVAPGVSSALAAPLAAGIPITSRLDVRSVAIITGSFARECQAPPIDYAALSRMDTIIIMMGLEPLRDITASLISAGLEPGTPAACIDNATTPRQQTVYAPLRDIAVCVHSAEFKGPAVTIVGRVAAEARTAEVAAGSFCAAGVDQRAPENQTVAATPIRVVCDRSLSGEPRTSVRAESERRTMTGPAECGTAGRARLLPNRHSDRRTIENRDPAVSETRFVDTARSLAGVRVVVTRPRKHSCAIVRELKSTGATVIECPLIEVQQVDRNEHLVDAIQSIDRYDWVLFTSANAAKAFARALFASGKDARCLHGVRIGAIGPATARAARRCGIAADLIPEQAGAESLADALCARPDANRIRRVLFPRGDQALSVLTDRLRAKGVVVDDPVVYRTVQAAVSDSVRQRLIQGFEAIVFYSPSAVAAFSDLHIQAPARVVAACAGPTTADAAARAGFNRILPLDRANGTALSSKLVRFLQEIES